jgi:hypothetical protein
MYQCWWRIYREINVFSRFAYSMLYVSYPFVLYLLTLPRIVILNFLDRGQEDVIFRILWQYIFLEFTLILTIQNNSSLSMKNCICVWQMEPLIEGNVLLSHTTSHVRHR